MTLYFRFLILCIFWLLLELSDSYDNIFSKSCKILKSWKSNLEDFLTDWEIRLFLLWWRSNFDLKFSLFEMIWWGNDDHFFSNMKNENLFFIISVFLHHVSCKSGNSKLIVWILRYLWKNIFDIFNERHKGSSDKIVSSTEKVRSWARERKNLMDDRYKDIAFVYFMKKVSSNHRDIFKTRIVYS